MLIVPKDSKIILIGNGRDHKKEQSLGLRSKLQKVITYISSKSLALVRSES